MKALSMSTNMVIVLVITAITLVVILAFFQGSGGRGIGQINLEEERTHACKVYVNRDIKCTGEAPGSATELNNIIEVCKKVGGYSCEVTSSSPAEDIQKCVRTCCSFLCPRVVE